MGLAFLTFSAATDYHRSGKNAFMKNRILPLLVVTWAGVGASVAATQDVDMINSTFSPSTVSVQVSDSVRWTMRDSFNEHSSTSGQPGAPDGLWDSGLLGEVGATFTHVFTTPGSFPYYCQPHFFFMSGMVTVTGGNTPPNVAITSPTDGANLIAPTNLTLQATATDDDAVVRVQFFDGGAAVGFDASSPYTLLAHFAVGSHTLTAVATDNLGVRATSAPVNITLTAAPAPAPTQVTNVTSTNIAWSGGAGPFATQRRSILHQPLWVNSAVNAARTSSIPALDQANFFRIADTANQPAIPLTVILSGAAERPNPVNTTATGSGTFALEGNVLRFNIRYAGLSTNSTAAHIHGPATAQQSTGVLIDFAPFHTVGGTNGTISGSVVLTPAQKAHILAGRTYVNVHSIAFGGGEIRGQLMPVLFQTFLNGANERPDSVNAPGSGLGTFALVGDQLTFNIAYRNLTSVASAAHIHGPADETQSTGVMINFAPFNGGSYGSSGNVAGTVTLTAAQLAALIDGLTYVNFHTSAKPAGEIRGQIRPQSTAVPLTAYLVGANERPTPVTSPGSGSAIFSLEGDILHFNIRYAGLSTNSTAAHIHGPSTAAGSAGVMIDLSPYHFGPFGSTNGTMSGSILLTATQKSNIVNGFTYVNVHSILHGGGEIRGHIAPVLMEAWLAGGKERPTPVDTLATGSGTLALVGNQLGFSITYRNLTGTASAAHIHGPATTSGSAGVLVDFAPFNGGSYGASGAVSGIMTLTPQNLAHVIDGMTYANFHTVTNGGGEIRGQITR
jgi:plastocyanin